ncbi:hypothetical protein Pint_09881 [Pistacia integerrima]|uniref:Uncharacterized protein n=1 Tax=Pistacia integerrima TaxID=434235 RepID=A0ACC0XJY0_9ROSI|nr:hypothetical protein Pint_09881 [Pistacia integerrima]
MEKVLALDQAHPLPLLDKKDSSHLRALLTGVAAVGSAFVGSPHGSWAAVIAVAAGALATTVNTLEHGGQVGMVLEMYRNCAGFFKLLEESIESTLDESEVEKRANGEMFEMEVG